MICQTRLKKNGTTSAGTPRYRCPNCGASSTGARAVSTRRTELRVFLDWLLGPRLPITSGRPGPSAAAPNGAGESPRPCQRLGRSMTRSCSMAPISTGGASSSPTPGRRSFTGCGVIGRRPRPGRR
ncbi:IS1/IS1595 family N-terminal zinc-binding domain-containing protein [Brevibacterium ammoniilyticum]|uniref:IS1/IS1595 family N-terminal zinc-binding domain-containing protein n=1 Tax=Brevibacterium ammoniilyticum TaxID=1046555 RepID=UPI003CD0700A